MDGVVERGEVEPDDPRVVHLGYLGWLFRVGGDDEEQFVGMRVVELLEVADELVDADRAGLGLQFEQQIWKLAEMMASGIDPCPTADWLLNEHERREASPEAAASSRSTTRMSSRSNTASIDAVTGFSPWRYVENNGDRLIARPPTVDRECPRSARCRSIPRSRGEL